MESVIIVRQYQILIASLSEELRAFLDDCLIGNKPAPVYTPPYNRYTTIILAIGVKSSFLKTEQE